MKLKTLQIKSFRNLKNPTCVFSEDINIISGDNAAGKTSLLEAIYFASHGRSFKNVSSNSLIQKKSTSCYTYAKYINNLGMHTSIGLSRNRKNQYKAHINNEKQHSLINVARIIPLLSYNPDCVNFFDDQLKQRQKLFIWLLFHVKQNFLHNWRKFNKALLNRNALLKQAKISSAELNSWDETLCQYNQIIEQMLTEVFENVNKELLLLLNHNEFFSSITKKDQAILFFHPGRPKEPSFADCLVKSRIMDEEKGYTRYGVHRFDIRLLYENKQIKKSMNEYSRSQKKLLHVFLLAACLTLINKSNKDKSSAIILDDLDAELDDATLEMVLANLCKIKQTQKFITTIRADLYKEIQTQGAAMFHVKHGEVNSV